MVQWVAIRTYSELMKLKTFEERFKYLVIGGEVGRETFGWDRYLNQKFYKDPVWKQIRRDVIVRDEGNDLGDEDYPIDGRIIVHHMNPVTVEDIEKRSEFLLQPEYLICVSHGTHQAIHYGTEPIIPKITERSKNDTCPWRRG